MFQDAKAFNGFAVDDIDAARSFYGETLGVPIEVLDEENGLISLKLGGERDTFVYRKPDLQPGNYTMLNFEVDDIEAAVDELAGRGVSFETYEGFETDQRGITTPSGGGPRIAWFKDPAGNILSVLQQP